MGDHIGIQLRGCERFLCTVDSTKLHILRASNLIHSLEACMKYSRCITLLHKTAADYRRIVLQAQNKYSFSYCFQSFEVFSRTLQKLSERMTEKLQTTNKFYYVI